MYVTEELDMKSFIRGWEPCAMLSLITKLK